MHLKTQKHLHQSPKVHKSFLQVFTNENFHDEYKNYHQKFTIFLE